MIHVQCNRCGRSFSAPPGGAAVMCPECGQRVEPMLAGMGVSAQPKGSGMAITSLVLGIIGLVPCFCAIPSLLAAIFGGIALMKDTAAKGLAIAGLVLGLMGFLIAPISVALYLPAIQAAREAARRASCTVKLKNIGLEIATYQQSHNGDFPASLDDLHLPELALQCPSENTPGPSPDYVYAPPVEKDSSSAMIACDITVNHINMRNVLFSDGHTMSMPEDEFQQDLGDPENVNLEKALSAAEGHGGLPHGIPLKNR